MKHLSRGELFLGESFVPLELLSHNIVYELSRVS